MDLLSCHVASIHIALRMLISSTCTMICGKNSYVRYFITPILQMEKLRLREGVIPW